MENQTGRKIVKLKTDHGGEYSSDAFFSYLLSEGIQTERGPAHRPMANSISERFNLSIIMKIRTQLVQSGLPLPLWGELAHYCSYQINCTPSRSLDGKITLDFFNSLIPTHKHPLITAALSLLAASHMLIIDTVLLKLHRWRDGSLWLALN